MSKILTSIWFSSFGPFGPATVGLVVIENEAGERKAYVGVGLGINQEYDERLIAANGGKLTTEMAHRIIEWLEPPLNVDKETLEKAVAWLDPDTNAVSSISGGGYSVPLFRR